MSFAASATGNIVERRLGVSGRGGVWVNLLALLAGSGAPRRTPHIRYTAPDGRTLPGYIGDCGDQEEVQRDRVETRKEMPTHQPEDSVFDTFFQRHEQPLYGYLRRVLPTHEIAMEVAQEAFFRAWTHFDEVRAYERPEAWLYRVATNLAISQLRRRHPLSFTQVFRRTDAGEESGRDGTEGEALADPLDVEGDATRRDLINRALVRLPERQRAALLLRAVHGFSGEEIAEMLGISVANARQILSRGRERFRLLYEEAAREGSETK